MQFSITITGEKHELAESLAVLKAVIGEQPGGTVFAEVLPPQVPAQFAHQPIAQPVQPIMTTPVTPVQYAPVQPALTAPAAPVQPPVTTAAPIVPTTVTTYTMEQLAVAATPLVDAGRGGEVTAILQQFGVAALTQLPKERYGEFATALRQLGAQI